MIIDITIGSKGWAKNEESVIRRIAQVVCGHTDHIRQRSEEEQNSGSYKWAINESANNWWASGLKTEGEVTTIRLTFRYGTEPMMSSLKIFLEWVFQ
jgi:hypothetical protein